MSVVYSPLCNTSLVAYTRYLATCCRDGAGFDFGRKLGGRGGEFEVGHGGRHVGGGVVYDVGTCVGAAGLVGMDGAGGRRRGRSVDSVGGRVLGDGRREVELAWDAAVCADGGSSGVVGDGSGCCPGGSTWKVAGVSGLRDESVALEQGYAETVATGASASYRRNRRKREQKKRQKERAVGGQQAPVGVRDVATPRQMRELAVQRAELYRLENERKIIKARREIAMEKQVEASGAQVQRVDNWIADVKNGSSRSSGSGWASHKTKSSKNSVWSKSWRSQSSAGTSGESVVSEEVHNAVLKRVTELERELAETKAISASRAAEARSNGLRADVVEREVFSLKVANKVVEVVTPEVRVTNKAAEFRATKGANPFNILTPDDTDWRSDEVGKLLDAVAAGQDEYSGLPYSGGGTPYYS